MSLALLQRRALLQAAAGLGAAATAGASAAKPPGRPGDFAFLSGEWRIHNRRPKKDGSGFDEFPGEATVHELLGGVCSIEELRIPVKGFAGIGLRLLNLETQVWHDHWVNAKSGVMTVPGQTGHFADGVGSFGATDEWEGKPLLIRGIWDRVTPKSCRWQQATSKDGGATWVTDWEMDWTRA
jgi:hypothetical protein